MEKYGLAVIVTDKLFPEVNGRFGRNFLCCGETLEKITAYNVRTCGVTVAGVYEACGDVGGGLSESISELKCGGVIFLGAAAFDIAQKELLALCELCVGKVPRAFADADGAVYAMYTDVQSACRFLSAGIAPEPAAALTTEYSPPASMKRLREYSAALREKIFAELEDSGVQIACADGVTISPLAKIEPGSVILQGTVIKGGSVVGRDSVIGPNSLVSSSAIGRGCVINSTQIYSSVLCDDVRIGPFCHIRPNCHIETGARIGDFVEVKNSRLGRNVHASHLTYIGDSDVGEGVNFGCGTVTVNYDGINKNRCIINDFAFIGCNTNLIAPVTVGYGAYTAAGSTITSDVPPDALAISRSREQRIVDGWVSRHKAKHKK